jgi:tRNA-splicing endonuclease subunit Sen2
MQRLLGIIGPDEQLVSEEVTERRREARQAMKRERARLQRVERDRLLREERGLSLFEEDMVGQTQVEAISHSSVEPNDVNDGLLEPIIASIPDLEHLQLTLYEALFLAVALDALSIIDEETERAIRRESVLAVLIDTVHLQACPMMQEVPADNAFLVQYAVYHHYRAHGWTVKPGIKFGVDWILYERGPVFSHADYSIVVLPDPRHENDPPCIQKQRPWWWLHAINRVNAQVKKTVILCYVSFDASRGVRLDQGLKAVLQRYLIREVGIKRWSAARNR